MRSEFAALASEYPQLPSRYDSGFSESPLGRLVKESLPAAIRKAVPEIEGHYEIQASVGKGGWTFTPWVAILDPTITTSVEDEFYVVYLLSLGREYLFLTINQGCTTLKNAVGIRGAKDELRRRADFMWSRIEDRSARLGPIQMDLNVDQSIWRGKLYETGAVVGVAYKTSDLPSENSMANDLREALALYSFLKQSGGWRSADEIVNEAKQDGVGGSLEQAKRYRQHRSIERQSSHSKKVKKIQGTQCKGCDFELADLYGPIAKDIIDAHHLVPISSLNNGDVVRLDPKKDFAVLCPNCHRVIHRMDDTGDIRGLRKLVESGALAQIQGRNR